jgi:hypothetical protein
MTARQITKHLVSGREIVICDNFADDATMVRVGQLLKTLTYTPNERSRPDTPPSGTAAAITDEIMGAEPFFDAMRQFGEEMFPGERFEIERVYVNNSRYGDAYFPHRDCAPNLKNVTVLYYGSLKWSSDFGGETLFFDDNFDAQFAVSPRPGRIIASRGAILHKGGVPDRVCYDPRYTIAYKLKAV